MRELEDALSEGSVEEPGPEARLVLEAATGRRLSQLVAGEDVEDGAMHRAREMARDRAAGRPLQYITGIAGFRHLELRVGPGVFIPRPETEIVVDAALSVLPARGTVVEIGTGSGAIALSIATERPDARVIATEKSAEALEYAELNLREAKAAAELVRGDLFANVSASVRGAVDVVVSNPPYVARSETDLVAEDVLAHEPHEALFAGDFGTEVIEVLAAAAPEWLRSGGWLVLEIGANQREVVESILRSHGFGDVEVGEDLAGRSRIAKGRRA